MKIQSTLFFILSLMVTNLFPQTTVLAVIDFEGKGVPQIEASALTDRLRTEIINMGNKKVVERGEMDEILKEQGLQQSGCVTSECLVEVGRLIGANQIVGGSISKVGNTFSVNARIINIETGEIINSINYDYSGVIDELLISGMRNVSQLLFSSESGGFVELDKDIEYYENGKIKGEGRTVANKNHGRWIYYYENGRIKEVGNYKNGKLIGNWTYYFENGKIQRVGNYKNGVKIGKWTYYNVDGSISLIKEIIKKNNNFWADSKMVEYYENGNKKEEVIFSGFFGLAKGIRTVWNINGVALSENKFFTGRGVYVEYYNNGQIKMSGPCKSFTKNGFTKLGTWLWWDKNGNLISKVNFDEF